MSATAAARQKEFCSGEQGVRTGRDQEKRTFSGGSRAMMPAIAAPEHTPRRIRSQRMQFFALCW
jgi:hypothetical protein